MTTVGCSIEFLYLTKELGVHWEEDFDNCDSLYLCCFSLDHVSKHSDYDYLHQRKNKHSIKQLVLNYINYAYIQFYYTVYI